MFSNFFRVPPLSQYLFRDYNSILYSTPCTELQLFYHGTHIGMAGGGGSHSGNPYRPTLAKIRNLQEKAGKQEEDKAEKRRSQNTQGCSRRIVNSKH